jgi:hypothetical protein
MNNLTRLLTVVFSLLFSVQFCAAQKIILVQKNYIYQNIGTGSSTSDWSHWFLMEGESTPRKAGYFGQHLRKVVASDSIAVMYMNSYASRQTFKLVTSLSTVALFSAFAISNLSKESVQPENFDKPDKNRGLLYVAGATFAANLMLRLIHPKSIQKAVDSYNGQAEQKGTSFSGFRFEVENVQGVRIVNAGIQFTLN